MKTDFIPSVLGDDPLDVLRLAACAAHIPDFVVPPEAMVRLVALVADGVLDTLNPEVAWPELSNGLMGGRPSRMLEVLRSCGALARLLPELDALFGIPQSADDPPEVDVGEHQLLLLDETARINAPLAARWAALLHKVGKAVSPREFWPAHYRHEARGEPLVAAICERFKVPAECRDLALLVLRECDRVHRAVDMRAAAIATMLERVEALRYPGRFEQLLAVCTCDYRAYPGRAGAQYPKAELLRRAFKAFAAERTPESEPAETFERRVQAVAAALCSERWANA
ncbi:tRNA nucleotidyltransferase [Methylocaldum szegediense]|jgi:tRNA nucleotidyltransferase (CCA-adding enzyme)|uniref:tRNA nucleotidyltransferase (CCA-adding enzyme) n=1 Tax=Methylocaldum szegediense TaxID=73780 RepID=A0ABM9I8U8_9GAMM|nr:tRNA nucleotidyltransferase [Methylocaldum szegediense]CAI8963339.1 tRNA nucleotidyltransferase (CCA-adding enzyme) [Methylocaldum szegediense]